jgi:hypothetical protein
MTESDVKLLLLFPMGLALMFMVWVLWRLEKQIRRGRSHSQTIAPAFNEADRPAPSSRVQAARSSDTAFGPPLQRIDQSSRLPRTAGR